MTGDTSPRRYRDVWIQISAGEDGVHPVSIESPAGSLKSTFRSPIPLPDLGAAISSLERSVVHSGSRSLGDEELEPDSVDAMALGRSLFDSVFQGEPRALLQANLKDIHTLGEGLRIGLDLRPAGASLAQLPWELMNPPEASVGHLALDPQVSIVRRRSKDVGRRGISAEIPLRVLVAMASPSDAPLLDLNRERKRIEESWGTCPGVDLEFLESVTLAELSSALERGAFHVLHYMGHADFTSETNEGVLVVETAEGLSDLVGAQVIGELVTREPTLQLVFLNACETAQSGASRSGQAFTGVAAAMVDAGVPAVVAMQFKVSDGAAIAFAEHFYDALTREYPVDGAMAEGRRSVAAQDPRTLEWATPVLFMRSDDGMLFDFEFVYGGVPH